MNKLHNSIDRFCILHPNFGIRNLMLYIAIANVAVFLLDMFSGNGMSLSALLCFTPGMVLRGQIWRLFTFVLIPEAGTAFSVLISCYFYYWIGTTLERQWGTAKFTCYYLCGMLLTVVGTTMLSIIIGSSIPVYSAHYVNFAMFLAFAILWPDAQVLLFFIIPIKIKYLAYADLAFFAYNIIRYVVLGMWFYSIVPVMALLNFVIFFWPELQRFLKLSSARPAKAARHFTAARQSAENTRREAQSASTGLRKCAVCGRTNATNPELDFRYCSRCAGYHCFCSDHIFSHVHFTEDQP